jgi:hypothetical protein
MPIHAEWGKGFSMRIVLAFTIAAVVAACPSKKPAAGEGEGAGAGEGEGEGSSGEGEGEGGGPCGTLTAAGACTSPTAGAFCDNGSRVDFDCTTQRSDAVCFVVNAAYGVDCGVPTTAICFDDTNGFLPCAGDGFACVITSSTRGQCQVNATGCTENNTCIEGRAVKDCVGPPGGQPELVDCASFGATCVDGAGCVRAPGDACTVDLTVCGTSATDAVACPGAGTCPPAGEGEGEGGQ